MTDWVEYQNISKGVYAVLKVLPEDTLKKILAKWYTRKSGHFGDLWDDISWEVALDLLWNPKIGIINEALAYKVIEYSLVESITAQWGINSAFIPHPMPKEFGKFFTVADYQVVYSLSYCLEKAMTQTTFNRLANSFWISKLLAKNGIKGIDGSHRDFDFLLKEIHADTVVEEFIQKLLKLVGKKLM